MTQDPELAMTVRSPGSSQRMEESRFVFIGALAEGGADAAARGFRAPKNEVDR